MKKALEMVDGSQFEKADVICVSDGNSDISSESQAEWSRRRAERGMRAYGVLIGPNRGEALIDEISDAVFRLDDLRGDLPALEVIFSTVWQLIEIKTNDTNAIERLSPRALMRPPIVHRHRAAGSPP